MQFTITTMFALLATITVSSALPQAQTCTPGQQYCRVCQPHQDGYPPNCVGTCNADGQTYTITKSCPTVCATECQFPSCPIVCD